MKEISLIKPPHHYVIRYDEGDEAVAIDALVQMVHDPRLNFDWFDAAVMSHQLGQHLAKELKSVMTKETK